MTTYEHMMVGVTGTLACGVHKKFGWPIVLMAGIVAITPDWDGLTILLSTQTFADGHRVWGHNIFACFLGLILGIADYRYDFSTRLANRILRTRPGRWFRSEIQKLSKTEGEDDEVTSVELPLRSERTTSGYLIWGLVGFLAVASHLLADLVVSGTNQLADWKLKLFWPFSDQGYVYPLVKWGDPGMSILFSLGMIAMIRWPARIQGIALATLSLVILYMVVL